MKELDEISLDLSYIENGLSLIINERSAQTLFVIDDALEHGEAIHQLKEGCFYDYELTNPDYFLADPFDNIIQSHKRTSHIGRIAPNIYVGTLEIPIHKKGESEPVEIVKLEVQSVKSGYRDDYRDMLALITEKCTDLLLQANSPVSQHFEIDFTRDCQTLYQKFAFIKSVIGTDEFAGAVHRIVTAPVTRWTETSEEKDIRNSKRFSNVNINEILKGSKRTKLPDSHYLRSYGISTLPERISTNRKTDSADTPENRFIKHALENFLKFCTDINNKAKEYGHKKMENESEKLIRELESQLHHTVFKSISRPTTLKLNSPVLQRKEGYRDVLGVWLMFDLASRLIWSGGDDIYSGGKKDVATLYEYWLFFKLLDLFQTIFLIEPKDISELIKETPDGLNLQLKQGKFTALKGIFNSGNRKLNIRFNYNRTFSGNKEYPDSGSWTTSLRPDYTLSFWPLGISEPEAENQELIVHVHFDAKYKIANLSDFLEQTSKYDLDEEKTENRKGLYKNADLLKMHAYKDAIRRTGGAYVLYPGDKSIKQKGFHEIIPGLGAFPVKPSKSDSGIGELKAFILEIIEHFINRASQREKTAFRIFDIHKSPPRPEHEVRDALPEAYGENRNLLPDETHVLVGYYNPTTIDWIISKGLYNARTSDRSNLLKLRKAEAGAKYLLLFSSSGVITDKLFKISDEGPEVWSKTTLIEKGYPKEPSQDNYLVYKIKPVEEKEFLQLQWNISKLPGFKPGKGFALPFVVTLGELMKAKL
jgi:predicted component of viral defense system (DUF524 family)